MVELNTNYNVILTLQHLDTINPSSKEWKAFSFIANNVLLFLLFNAILYFATRPAISASLAASARVVSLLLLISTSEMKNVGQFDAETESNHQDAGITRNSGWKEISPGKSLLIAKCAV